MNTFFLALALAFGLNVHTAPQVSRIHMEDACYSTAVDILVFPNDAPCVLVDVPGYTREFTSVRVERHGTSIQFFETERHTEPFLVVFPGGYVLDVLPEVR